MDLFGAWAKRRALRKYAGLLPRRLARDYGAAEFYTPGQIRAAVARLKLDAAYLVYANAMFLPEAAFEAGESGLSYAELRGEFLRYVPRRSVSSGAVGGLAFDSLGGGVIGGGFDGGGCGHGGGGGTCGF
jgi:hypothetical protein